MAPTNSRGHSTSDPKGVSTKFNPHDELKTFGRSSQQGGGHSHARGQGNRNQHQPYSGSSSAMGHPEGSRAMATGNGGHHMDETSNSRLVQQPTPLFERLVTEEVQELKAYARIIENQNRRLAELERVHGDLESRLQLESRRRVQLETTLEEREREWALKFQQLEEDRDHWKDVVSSEQNKNARLIDQVVRKDQDIHRMLQRKVSFMIQTELGAIRRVGVPLIVSNIAFVLTV